MAVNASEDGAAAWRSFLRRHWMMFALWATGGILAAISAILVFLWFVGDAQAKEMVPTTLFSWTMENCMTFVLNLILWEVLLIGIPVAIAAGVGWLGWKRIPVEERKEYRFFGPRSRATSGGGGAISLLVFVAFCFKVYLDGRWNIPISSWPLNYLVYSWLTACAWVLILFGVPIAVGVIWWVGRKSNP